jgi:predicted small metal-binding protein
LRTTIIVGAEASNSTREEDAMARQVKCECGYVVRGANDDEVVAKTREHLRSDHPDVLDRVSDADIRSWIEIVA